MESAFVLHLSSSHFALTAHLALVVMLGLAGVGSVLVAGLGLAAFVRRRSRSFLLVALALSALLARTAVAVVSMVHMVPSPVHHVLEHGLDVAMTVLVLAAVYYARTVERAAEATDSTEGGRL